MAKEEKIHIFRRVRVLVLGLVMIALSKYLPSIYGGEEITFNNLIFFVQSGGYTSGYLVYLASGLFFWLGILFVIVGIFKAMQ